MICFALSHYRQSKHSLVTAEYLVNLLQYSYYLRKDTLYLITIGNGCGMRIATWNLVGKFTAKFYSSAQPRILLKDVSWFTSEKDLENYFGRFGKVNHVKLVYDWDTGLHRGFAFVTFECVDGALRAVQKRNHLIDGRSVKSVFILMASRLFRTVVVLSNRSLKTVQKKNPELFVKKISWVTGAKELTDYFSQFGKVTSVTLPFDLRTGLHKGFAFISFADDDFYEKIQRSDIRHIIDDEEVICVLADEETSLLSTKSARLGVTERVKSGDSMKAKVQGETKQRKSQTTRSVVQDAEKTDNLVEVSSDKDQDRIARRPVITELADSRNGIEEDGDRGYTVVQLSNNSRSSSVRNSFDCVNISNKRNFKGGIPLSKR